MIMCLGPGSAKVLKPEAGASVGAALQDGRQSTMTAMERQSMMTRQSQATEANRQSQLTEAQRQSQATRLSAKTDGTGRGPDLVIWIDKWFISGVTTYWVYRVGLPGR